MSRVPVEIQFVLDDFLVMVRLPLDLKWSEAKRIAEMIELSIVDPSESAKAGAVEPDLFGGITDG